MAVIVTTHLNRAEIATFLYTPAGPIVRGARKLGKDVQREAKFLAPKDTGRLAASIGLVVGSAPGFVYAEIGSKVHYALWRHEGTGIYGTGRPIRPVRAKYLRFQPRRAAGRVADQRRGYVYARSVRGTPGKPYLVGALTAVMGAHARIRTFSGGARRG
jgi:hypothetical protein